MGAKSSKSPPRKIEPDVTGVEVFEDSTPQASSENGKHKKHKGGKSVLVAVHAVRVVGHDGDANESELTSSKPEDIQQDKQKKKRKHSKKDKSKMSSSPPIIVRAQTQLNEVKNVKPLLKQSPQARQQHFEQIKEAYALDEEEKKAPPVDLRSRFFSYENWKKTPQTPTNKSDEPVSPAPLTCSHAATVPRGLFESSRSSRGTEEFSNGVEENNDNLALDDVETLALPPPSRISAITSPITAATPSFLAPFNKVDYSRPDVQTTPVIRVKIGGRQTPERLKSSVRSDLRLDDVDEDLMEHILTNGDY